ncbi:protoporphyrinogen oxidase [Conyzicola nivalis]|uniref:Protoporphyrinogen oxidase n=1 Tax=Conyzicola nivalis TaxID=1477021 RepID=A0A916SN30_9MICO|nr:FAD-dependent oxidoreductase [Conyzicola nivalis]GGB08304.1 protoporphyrinogen oxidase [Conyzicola nivalis]
MSDVVVVGGGIAGLVIARKLLIEGKSVTLLEAGDRLGGSVSRHVVGGIALDAGAESFATRGGTVEALVRDLGLGDEIVAPNPAGAWLQPVDGPAVPIPATSLLGIPGSPVAEDVIAVLGQSAALRAFAVDAFLPGTVGSKATTLGELVRRRMGDDVLDKLVAPIVNGVHSASPDDLDLDRVAPHLRAALRREGSLARAVRSLRVEAPAGTAVAGLRGGISRIVDELVADLDRFGADVRLNTSVRSVTVGSATTDDDVLGGHIVVAASGVLGPLATPDRVVTLATLVVEQPLLDAAPRGTGLLVAKGARGIRARALTHATAKWQWLAERADGRHVLRLSYGEDPAGLAEIARADAAALLGVPIDPAAVVDFARVQWTRTTAVETAPDGVTLVGEGIAGTGLANIIGHSLAQADAVVRGELQ